MVRRNQQKLSNEFSFLTFKNKNLRNKNQIVSSLETFLPILDKKLYFIGQLLRSCPIIIGRD